MEGTWGLPARFPSAPAASYEYLVIFKQNVKNEMNFKDGF